MVFINLRQYALAMFTLLMLASCASNRDKPEQDPDAAAEAEGERIEALANPYLAQPVEVPPAAAEQFRTAVVVMQGENWDDAEQLLRALHQSYPTLAGPLVNLGISLWRQDEIEAAEEAFAEALRVNPLHNDAYVQYGVMLREQGRFDEAEQLYLSALEVWPHNPQALRNLGILYDLYMGKFEQALEQYELALKIMPEPSREMQGWIIDLKRRMAAAQEE